jgi:two-component system LytT family response regulator
VEKILILHTEVSDQTLSNDILTAAGFNTYIAEDIESGIDIAKIYQPDMIILESTESDKHASGIIHELQKDDNIRIKPLIYISCNPEAKGMRQIMSAGADDYIIAPYSNYDLVDAVNVRLNKYNTIKLKCDELRKETIEGDGDGYVNKNHILVKIGAKLRLIKFEKIVCVTAQKEYSKIITAESKKYIIRKSLRKWIEILPEDNFLQIHRATIINTEFINRIEIQPEKNYLVHLKSHEEPFPISQRYAKKLTKKFYT